jgi:hypothetical protein
MLNVGSAVALSRLLPMPDELSTQPQGSYLVPIINAAGGRWVTESEPTRCETALQIGAAADQIATLGPQDELLSLGDAAVIGEGRLARSTGEVTAWELHQAAQRHPLERHIGALGL